MSISVKILADSVAPSGPRLTTKLLRYPRSIHAEIMTHRETSKNSASSRAIPTDRLIAMIESDPFIPMYIGANQRGMQAGDELAPDVREQAVGIWRDNLRNSIQAARAMLGLGVHKQVVNRMVEVGMHIEIIISSTSWTNWDGLRDNDAAEPHFHELARVAREAREASTPRVLQAGEWHLPLWADNGGHEDDWRNLDDFVLDELRTAPAAFDVEARKEELAVKISVGRCARVSYMTHEGRRDIAEDIKLHDKMVVQEPLHASPAEHVAKALDWPRWTRAYPDMTKDGVQALQNKVLMYHREHDRDLSLPGWLMMSESALAQMRSGNFMGFQQYRKMMPNEYIGGLRP